MAETPEQLDAVARDHRQSEGFTPRLIACRARTLERVLPRGTVLDLGCADGLLTAHLAARHRRVVGVDASPIRIARSAEATKGHWNVELRQGLFDDLTPGDGEPFDGIVLSCVLEHVADPPALLRQVAPLLSPGGRVVAIVPHGRSLHRHAGVIMGALRDLDDHGEADHALEHERVYTRETLAADFAAAGLRVVDEGGHLLKPLPNAAMASLAPALVDAYEELGRRMPDLAAEIWAAGER